MGYCYEAAHQLSIKDENDITSKKNWINRNAGKINNNPTFIYKKIVE